MGCVPNKTGEPTVARRSAAFSALTPRADVVEVGVVSNRVEETQYGYTVTAPPVVETLQLNRGNTFDQMNRLSQANHIAQINQTNQITQMQQINQMNYLNQAKQLNPITQVTVHNPNNTPYITRLPLPSTLSPQIMISPPPEQNLFRTSLDQQLFMNSYIQQPPALHNKENILHSNLKALQFTQPPAVISPTLHRMQESNHIPNPFIQADDLNVNNTTFNPTNSMMISRVASPSRQPVMAFHGMGASGMRVEEVNTEPERYSLHRMNVQVYRPS